MLEACRRPLERVFSVRVCNHLPSAQVHAMSEAHHPGSMRRSPPSLVHGSAVPCEHCTRTFTQVAAAVLATGMFLCARSWGSSRRETTRSCAAPWRERAGPFHTAVAPRIAVLCRSGHREGSIELHCTAGLRTVKPLPL